MYVDMMALYLELFFAGRDRGDIMADYNNNVIVGYSSIINDDCIWFFAYNRNYLCCFNYKKGEKSFYRVNDSFDDCDRQLYHTILTIDSWLLLVPRVAEDIVLFNKESKEIHRLEIPRHKKISNDRFLPDDAKFCSGFTYGRCFFLLGVSFPGILKIDSDNFQIEIIDDWIDEVNKFIDREYIGYISLGYSINNDRAVIPLMCVQGVLILDLKSLTTSIRLIDGPHTGGVYSLSGDVNEGLWTTGFNDNDDTVCYILGKDIKRYSIEDIKGDIHLFYPPIIMANSVILVPVQYEKNIYKLDEESKTFRKWIRYDQIENALSITGYSFMEPIVYNERILLVDGQNFDWHFVNYLNADDYCFQIDVGNEADEREFWQGYIESAGKNGNIISEKKVSLDYFLKSL